MKPACPRCRTINPAEAVRAIDRFDRRRTTTYAAAYTGAPIRETREQAEADYCQWRCSHGHQTGARP